jgi:formyltetrahydrofolate synthetase
VAYRAARVFNPTVAVQMDTKNMKNAIKSLQSFGFDVFHDINEITNDISNELTACVARVGNTTNECWNLVEGAGDHDTNRGCNGGMSHKTNSL